MARMTSSSSSPLTSVLSNDLCKTPHQSSPSSTDTACSQPADNDDQPLQLTSHEPASTGTNSTWPLAAAQPLRQLTVQPAVNTLSAPSRALLSAYCNADDLMQTGKPVSQLTHCSLPVQGGPIKTVHFLKYHILQPYNHAVFADVFRNYSRKQQATIF